MKKYFFRLKCFLGLNQGFSLIELSVVMTVAASAAVGFLSWTQPAASTNATKATATLNKMKDIQSAIDSFRAQKRRLPCPADPLMRSDNTRAPAGTDYLTPTGDSHDYYVNDFGMEDLDRSQATVNSTTTLGVDCPVSVGSLPVFSLGLDDTYMIDAWGRRFTYHVASSICGTDAGTESGISSSESENIGCNELSYKNNTGNLTVTGGNTANAAYVVVSHGANGNGAFLPSGEKLNDGVDNELLNSNGGNTYVKADQSTNFDDLVVFETKNQIESAVNRKNIRNISVADCEANSQALKQVTLTEAGYMKSGLALTNYQQNGSNVGDQGLLGILKFTQSICVAYYGASASTINGQTWGGAQCPGNTTGASTYTPGNDSCSCLSGLWDGNCTIDLTVRNGLQLWLDANDSTTLFTNNDCATGGSPSNGNSIACWKDKSGTGNHAIAGTAPTYTTGAQNSKAVLTFDGASTYLTSSTLTLPTTASIFAVASPGATSGFKNIITNNLNFFLGAGNGAANYFASFYGNNAAWGTSSDHGASGAMSSGSYYVLGSITDGVNDYSYINGTALTMRANAMTSFSDGYIIGSSAASSQYWDGTIGEILIYNTALSNSDRLSIQTYLGIKWGITVP